MQNQPEKQVLSDTQKEEILEMVRGAFANFGNCNRENALMAIIVGMEFGISYARGSKLAILIGSISSLGIAKNLNCWEKVFSKIHRGNQIMKETYGIDVEKEIGLTRLQKLWAGTHKRRLSTLILVPLATLLLAFGATYYMEKMESAKAATAMGVK